jgi:hypothetical protein
MTVDFQEVHVLADVEHVYCTCHRLLDTSQLFDSGCSLSMSEKVRPFGERG